VGREKGNDNGEELYRRFLDGDEKAFEALVSLYEHELSLFIFGMVHDLHETRHFVIETFAQLAVCGNFKGKSSLKTYIFSLEKNLAARHVRMRRCEAHLAFENIMETVLGESETPQTFLLREENKRSLNAAMQDLKPDYSTVLHLLYFEDMSYREAGQVMKKSERKIEGLAYRAKAALKKKLESEGFDYVGQ